MNNENPNDEQHDHHHHPRLTGFGGTTNGGTSSRQLPRFGALARAVTLNLRAMGSDSQLHVTNNEGINNNNNNNDDSSSDDDDDDDNDENERRTSLLFSDDPLVAPPQLYTGFQSNTNRFLRAATTLQNMKKVSKNVTTSNSSLNNNNNNNNNNGVGGGEGGLTSLTSIREHPKDHTNDDDGNKSVRSSSNGSEVLQTRLDEINIYEIIKDGPTNNLHLTVRGLHKHVLWCITQPMTVTDVSALRKSKVFDQQPSTKTITTQKGDDNIDDRTATTTTTNNKLQREEDIITTPSNDSAGPVLSATTTAASVTTGTKSIIASKRSSSNLSNEEKEKKTRFADLQSTMQHEEVLLSSNSSNQLQREVSDPDGVLQGSMDHPNQNSNHQHVATTARERLGGYLHPRDMRRLVSPFSASNEPDLIVRRHVMLLNFDPLRAIIIRDRILIIVPEGAEILCEALERRIRGGSNAVMNTLLGHASSYDASNNPTDGSAQKIVDGTSESVAPTQEAPVSDETPPPPPPSATATGPTKSSSATKLKSLVQTIKSSSASMSANDDSMKGTSETFSMTNNNSVASDPDLYDDGGEWDDIHNTTNVVLPFELLCVDSVLYIVTRILMDDTYQLQGKIYDYMLEEGITHTHHLQEDNTGKHHHKHSRKHHFKKRKKQKQVKLDPLSMIRLQKDAVSEMTNRVNRFVQSMNRILDRDEEMALMNLSRLITHPERFVKPVDVAIITEELDEPQLILEAHLQIGLTLENALTLLQGQLTTSNDLIGQKLTALTNRLLFANTLISVFALCVGLGSFVGSIFGMNVTNKLEDSDTAFLVITIATIIGAVSLGGFIMLVFVWTGTVPTAGLMERL